MRRRIVSLKCTIEFQRFLDEICSRRRVAGTRLKIASAFLLVLILSLSSFAVVDDRLFNASACGPLLVKTS